MIIVTGATGKLGRGIVEALLAQLPADQIAASVRDPDKAVDLAERGVRVRKGDFADPDSLAFAFGGASQVLIVSSNARASGGDPLAQHRAAIDAALGAGAQRIVYTSHMGVSTTSAFASMHDHAATEAMLREAGIAWTALRNGSYASTVPTMIGDAATTGVLDAPEDGKYANPLGARTNAFSGEIPHKWQPLSPAGRPRGQHPGSVAGWPSAARRARRRRRSTRASVRRLMGPSAGLARDDGPKLSDCVTNLLEEDARLPIDQGMAVRPASRSRPTNRARSASPRPRRPDFAG